MVEEEVEYSVGKVDWDVANMHWFVVWQWPGVRGGAIWPRWRAWGQG